MPSIGVLEHYQKPTDKPTRRIKRSGGQSLVNRGMAFWLVENVLLQFMENQDKLAKLPITQRYSPKSFIPEKMPSHKTPGTRVEGPLTEKSTTGIFRILQANHLAREQRV